MSQIFSEVWMQSFKTIWNKSPEFYESLQKANFASRIGYGFKNEPRARGFIFIVNGKVDRAGTMDDVELDWDLRASQENWESWMKNGFGLTKLGPAVATNSLQFVKGDYRQMIRNISLSKPFLDHFELMRKV